MKRLLIIGAGGFGREVYSSALYFEGTEWQVAGFLDDRAGILDGLGYAHPVIGSPESYEPGPDDVFLVALGDPAERRRYSELITSRGGELTRLVNPKAEVSERTRWGGGVTVGPFCTISPDVTLGEGVCINSHVAIGHDAEIGAYTQVSSFAFIGGGARIGADVTIQPNAVVPAGCRVDDGATVGAGSVALRVVRKGTTVFGVPAVPLRLQRDDAAE